MRYPAIVRAARRDCGMVAASMGLHIDRPSGVVVTLSGGRPCPNPARSEKLMESFDHSCEVARPRVATRSRASVCSCGPGRDGLVGRERQVGGLSVVADDSAPVDGLGWSALCVRTRRRRADQPRAGPRLSRSPPARPRGTPGASLGGPAPPRVVVDLVPEQRPRPRAVSVPPPLGVFVEERPGPGRRALPRRQLHPSKASRARVFRHAASGALPSRRLRCRPRARRDRLGVRAHAGYPVRRRRARGNPERKNSSAPGQARPGTRKRWRAGRCRRVVMSSQAEALVADARGRSLRSSSRRGALASARKHRLCRLATVPSRSRGRSEK